MECGLCDTGVGLLPAPELSPSIFILHLNLLTTCTENNFLIINYVPTENHFKYTHLNPTHKFLYRYDKVYKLNATIDKIPKHNWNPHNKSNLFLSKTNHLSSKTISSLTAAGYTWSIDWLHSSRTWVACAYFRYFGMCAVSPLVSGGKNPKQSRTHWVKMTEEGIIL